MTETTDRAALIVEAHQMSKYVQAGGPDDGTVYERLAGALADAERELDQALVWATHYRNLYRDQTADAERHQRDDNRA